jgi:Tfp pilus assembly PilM family ATPase
LRQVKQRLGAGMRDTVVSCLSGKQVFATQMDFRRLGPEEMEQALRLELRKIVHFEVATSALDFEILDDGDGSTGGKCQVMLGMAANSLLSRHMQILERAGLRPAALDVLPLAVANALWAWRGEGNMESPAIALHAGSHTTTLVIDGEYSPFFNRSIPFSPDETLNENLEPSERARRINSLAEEISRSLAFHEKSSGVSGFRELAILGERLDDAALADAVRRRAGLAAFRMDLASKYGGKHTEGTEGRFDLAIAMALRGDA